MPAAPEPSGTQCVTDSAGPVCGFSAGVFRQAARRRRVAEAVRCRDAFKRNQSKCVRTVQGCCTNRHSRPAAAAILLCAACVQLCIFMRPSLHFVVRVFFVFFIQVPRAGDSFVTRVPLFWDTAHAAAPAGATGSSSLMSAPLRTPTESSSGASLGSVSPPLRLVARAGGWVLLPALLGWKRAATSCRRGPSPPCAA